nr:FKBP-type peptidyl-prolyl cis-trans isomerase [Microcella alkalica]
MLGTLTACAPSGAAACAPAVPTGTQPGFVDATGALLSPPDVEFPTPLSSDGPQQAVLVPGDGEVADAGQIVDLQVSLFDGETGELITASAYDPEAAPLRRTAGAEIDIIAEAVQCAEVGSRIAATATIADVFGAAALDPQTGLEDDDPVVLVIDIQAAYLAKADGAPQLGASSVPAVVTTPEGVPGITIPDEDPSEELIDHVLLLGDGAALEAGDRAVLHYTGVVWQSGEVFDSSWDRGAASTFPVTSFEDDPGGIVPGLAEALEGKTVGSQLVVVIPPELGYPEGQAPASIPPGSTMVFVVDLLGIEE